MHLRGLLNTMLLRHLGGQQHNSSHFSFSSLKLFGVNVCWFSHEYAEDCSQWSSANVFHWLSFVTTKIQYKSSKDSLFQTCIVFQQYEGVYFSKTDIASLHRKIKLSLIHHLISFRAAWNKKIWPYYDALIQIPNKDNLKVIPYSEHCCNILSIH